MTNLDHATYEARVQAARAGLEAADLQALLVFDPLNIRYLTGFTGSDGVVVVRPDEVVLLSDFRYRLQAAEEAPGARFLELEEQLSAALPAVLADLGSPVGVETSHLTMRQWERINAVMGKIPHAFTDGIVERLRMVKEPKEVAAIKEAGRLVAAVLERLAGMRVVGRRERDVALEMEMWVREQGSEPVPFTYIVASGPRGAMPHAEASEAMIEPGELLVVDIGARVDGYASDVTRTFATGPLDQEKAEMHALVLHAQEQARQQAGPGMACVDLDGVARGIITAAGKGELFKHGLGHGVGLDVHEEPRVSGRSKDVLEPGMVVTIEPGVYVPGVGGVRIEDTVVVTAEGIEVLTECARGPIQVG